MIEGGERRESRQREASVLLDLEYARVDGRVVGRMDPSRRSSKCHYMDHEWMQSQSMSYQCALVVPTLCMRCHLWRDPT